MKVKCLGTDTVGCDAECAHAVPHEIHDAGCSCADCYLDSTHRSVGCLENDYCEKVKKFVRCLPITVEEPQVKNMTYGNACSKP